ncbi:D-alanine--D-alanine ligase family protein [Acetivibrio cellulolyticus]|uniref:D-alanine--D-alanine ligase n=1 Tax=Acetivibrio cellulolyticus TaxID=35830 RepID=UPI0001E2C1D9|nr:D-alanine--D-alanine ligase [Acetivibrio cellulolyticus]
MKINTIGIVFESREDALKVASTMVRKEHVNIDVLYHWREKEEISAVVSAVKNLGFEVRILGTPDDIITNMGIVKKQVDFIFNLSVGFRRRFRLSVAPAIYEAAGVPYSGADPYTKMVCQNKHLMKSLWDKMNIPTPPWAYIDNISKVQELELPEFPIIIKPAYEGNSIGINANAVAYNKEELFSKIEAIYSTLHMPLIIEKFIAGKEYKIVVIGNKNQKFIGMVEYLNGGGSSLRNEFIYFSAKVNGDYYQVRRDINLPEYKSIKSDCQAIYEMFLPVDYGTFDIRVDEYGKHYFLEFNADDSLHPVRTMAQCCKLNDIDYEKMIESILKSSFERWD